MLVVDDSAFMRAAVARVLAADARFEVVGQARDGAEALELVPTLRPELVTMDFNMPGMNGAEVTAAIMAQCPVPIVMLSAHTREGAHETVQALAAGAVDFVTKPAGEVSASLADVRAELCDKLAAAARARPGALRAPAPAAPVATPKPRLEPLPAGLRVVCVAASTGGPAALAELLPRLALPAEVALLVVQHLPAGFTAPLAARLAERTSFPVREALEGEALVGGVALLAPGGRHLVVGRDGRLGLSDEPPLHGVKPAADVTLRSLAAAFGPRVLSVVLTGMGKDGALGSAAVKAAGGRVLAQDRASSTVWGMPRAVTELGVADAVEPLSGLPGAIGRVIRA